MGKKTVILFAAFMTIFLFSVPPPHADGLEVRQQATFVLPLSLQEIEEGAFSDTAVETVIFPDGLVSIREKAFSGAKGLTDAFIPESTKYIAASAFPITPDLVIHGVKGSYAEDWAKKHKIPFVEANIWILTLDNGKTVSFQERGTDFFYGTANLRRVLKIVPRAEDEDKSNRPQDRPELNPIDYRFP